MSLSKFVYGELQSALVEYLPEGSDQAYRFDLARRLKRVGQGFNEITDGELEQRVREAIEQGSAGVLPGSSDGPTADQSTLPSVPTVQPKPRNRRGNGRRGEQPGNGGNGGESTQ